MATLFGMFPFLKTLFADSGYQGPKFAKALAKVLPHLDIEIVKRSDQVSGFVVLPKTLDRRAHHCVAQSLPKARQGIGRISTEKRSRSCASPQSASCSENSAIRPEVSGRTLMPDTRRRAQDLGWIEMIVAPAKGRNAVYRWGPTAKNRQS